MLHISYGRPFSFTSPEKNVYYASTPVSKQELGASCISVLEAIVSSGHTVDGFLLESWDIDDSSMALSHSK